jgi:hypothetical protein
MSDSTLALVIVGGLAWLWWVGRSAAPGLPEPARMAIPSSSSPVIVALAAAPASPPLILDASPIAPVAPSVVPTTTPARTLSIVNATYGGNVGVAPGNWTGIVAAACNGRTICDVTVNTQQLAGGSFPSDPAPGRPKDFRVDYTIAGVQQPPVIIPAEAAGHTIRISV